MLKKSLDFSIFMIAIEFIIEYFDYLFVLISRIRVNVFFVNLRVFFVYLCVIVFRIQLSALANDSYR